jgi:hypothetical protein
MITAAEAAEALRTADAIGAVSPDVYRKTLKAVVAFHAIFASLPKCDVCDDVATRTLPLTRDHRCDACTPKWAILKSANLPYADAVRALKGA